MGNHPAAFGSAGRETTRDSTENIVQKSYGKALGPGSFRSKGAALIHPRFVTHRRAAGGRRPRGLARRSALQPPHPCPRSPPDSCPWMHESRGVRGSGSPPVVPVASAPRDDGFARSAKLASVSALWWLCTKPQTKSKQPRRVPSAYRFKLTLHPEGPEITAV